MAFMIWLIPENKEDLPLLEPEVRFGEIVLGEYVERFEAPTSYWTAEDYQEHWKQAIERIVGGEEKSCLITSMYDPELANFIFWWPIFREGTKVFVQNQVLFLKDDKTPLNPLNPFASIKDRQTLTEDGLLISEWEISISELEFFLNSFK